METSRLEAFSDGVVAVIITIMVLELKVPHGVALAALRPELPVFTAYVLSFIYVGIYWNNHHHLLHATPRIDGRSMWSNLHLLFWLSLVPFSTAWVGENPSAKFPTAVYGLVLLMAAIAYWLLQSSIIAFNGRDALVTRALGADWKGKVSPVLYCVAIAAAFVSPVIADVVYATVAALWFVPDPRIERVTLEENPLPVVPDSSGMPEREEQAEHEARTEHEERAEREQRAEGHGRHENGGTAVEHVGEEVIPG